MVSSDVFEEKFQQFCFEFVNSFLHEAKAFHKDAIKEEKLKVKGTARKSFKCPGRKEYSQ